VAEACIVAVGGATVAVASIVAVGVEVPETCVGQLDAASVNETSATGGVVGVALAVFEATLQPMMPGRSKAKATKSFTRDDERFCVFIVIKLSNFPG
jgi:hypothetical protein